AAGAAHKLPITARPSSVCQGFGRATSWRDRESGGVGGIASDCLLHDTEEVVVWAVIVEALVTRGIAEILDGFSGLRIDEHDPRYVGAIDGVGPNARVFILIHIDHHEVSGELRELAVLEGGLERAAASTPTRMHHQHQGTVLHACRGDPLGERLPSDGVTKAIGR